MPQSSGIKSTRIRFDDEARTFRLTDTGDVFSYDEIGGYDLIEESGNMGRGGIARAFSANFFDEKRGIFVATSMKLKISLRSSKDIFLNFIITPMKSNSFIYRALREEAESILTKLQHIQPENSLKEGRPFDYTEELRRLKRLVDDGVITQAEYDAKKRNILGL